MSNFKITSIDVAWQKILDKYVLIKKVFIECEETDPELKTNIQPLNEFRATLDHIMKMVDSYYKDKTSENWIVQYNRLNSHLDRAFFDICDMLSINYRNKILDILSRYDTDAIRTALPDYYSSWKMQIEDISNRISTYRTNKGVFGSDDSLFNQYQADVFTLREIFKNISHQQTVLENLANENRKISKRNNRLAKITYMSFFMAIVSLLVSLLQMCSK